MSKLLRVLPLMALLTGPLAGAQVSTPASYQGPVPSVALPDVPEVGPLWTLKVDRAEDGEPAALLAGNWVFVKVGGDLQARDVATGRVIWTLRKTGDTPLAWQRASGEAAFVTQGRTLSAYRAGDGKRLWTRDLGDLARDVGESGGVLYVTTGKGGLALNAATGAVRWQFSEPEMTGFRAALNGVVFWSAYQGEPHFPATYAFDGVTGRKLYRLGGTTGPLGVRGDAVLMADASFIGNDDNAALSWVNLRSGVPAQVLKLAADFRCPGRGGIERSSSEPFYAAPHVYVKDQCGTRLRQFWVNGPAPTGKTPTAPLPPARTFAAPDEGHYRAGPMGELLVFESRAGEVRLIPVSGRSPVNYNGVNMPTGPGLALPGAGQVSRLDVLGNTLYLGRRTGRLLAYDAAKKKALYSMRLPWPGFGPTLQAGGYVLLTTPGAVAVVGEP